MALSSLLLSLLILLISHLTHQNDSIPPDEHAPDATQLLIQAGISEEEISNETSTESESSTLATEKPQIRFRKLVTTTPDCRKLSEEEKYKLLSKNGGLNQRFMATNSTQAGLFFRDSFPAKKAAPSVEISTRTRLLPVPKVIISEPFSDTLKVNPCDSVCQSIINKLNDAEKTRKASPPPLRDAPPLPPSGKTRLLLTSPVHEKSDLARGANCAIDNAYFVPMDNCTKPGEEDEQGSGLVSLCTLCRGFYVFPSPLCFPSILNSLHCGEEFARKCIFDHFNTAHGECEEQTLVMKILENRGDEECEDWKVVQIDLSVACQCALNPQSNFLSAVPFIR